MLQDNMAKTCLHFYPISIWFNTHSDFAISCDHRTWRVFAVALHLCKMLSWQQFPGRFQLHIYGVLACVRGPTSGRQLAAEVTSAVTHQQSGFSFAAKRNTLSQGYAELQEGVWACVLRSDTRDACRAECVITLRSTFSEAGLLFRRSR